MKMFIVGLLAFFCFTMYGLFRLDSRVYELEAKLERMKATYKIHRLDVRVDACIDSINKLAKESKVELGFWVPTPVPIGNQFAD
jgi:hypothetical protein